MGIDPIYYLDLMSQDEVLAIYKAKALNDRVGWEQARLISFFSVVAQQGTKNCKSPDKLYPFPWDKEQPKVKVKSKRLTPSELQLKASKIKRKNIYNEL